MPVVKHTLYKVNTTELRNAAIGCAVTGLIVMYFASFLLGVAAGSTLLILGVWFDRASFFTPFEITLTLPDKPNVKADEIDVVVSVPGEEPPKQEQPKEEQKPPIGKALVNAATRKAARWAEEKIRKRLG